MGNRNRVRYGAGSLAATVILCSGSAVHAQINADRAALISEDIIVTAQKRSESVQDIPAAVTALSGDTLVASSVSGLEGLQRLVPNLNIGNSTGVARIALRGIGLENISTGAEGSVAFHTNGVFISRSAAALSSFYDVERVEVLRGPQGTLYGRNATGGAINVISRSPTDDLSGYLRLTVGNYDTIVTEGAMSGALVEGVVLARLAFRTTDHDGYGRNVVTGRSIDNARQRSARLTLELRPTEDLKVVLMGDYHRENDRNYGYHYIGPGAEDTAGNPVPPLGILLGGVAASNREDYASERDPRNRRTFWGVSGEVTAELGAATLRSLTAYRKSKYLLLVDADSTNLPLVPIDQQEDAEQFSEEIQLSGSGERIDWLIGAFYFYERNFGSQIAPLSDAILGAPPPGTIMQGYFGGGVTKTNAVAGFGQATYKVTDQLNITLGARYSWEKKSVDESIMLDFARPYDPANPIIPLASQRDSATFKSFTPRLGVDFQPNEDILLYASYSKGFKSGTYNLGAVQQPVRPEKVDAYEIGLKTTFAERAVRANLSAFYYDYTDLQVGKVTAQVLALENAATATIYGLEAELRVRPAAALQLDGNIAWLHATFDSYVSADPARPAGDGQTMLGGVPAFNLAGNRLSQAPRWSASGGAEYQIALGSGTVTLRGELTWTDRVYFSPFNRVEVSQGAKTKANAFLTFASEDERWSASAFIRNIGGKRTIQNALVATPLAGSPINASLDEPRLYGVTVGFAF